MTHQCPTGRHPAPAHGCYTWHHCRCPGCTAANTAASADYRTTLARLGRLPPGRMPAGPTRARVQWLRDVGATNMWIAARAGLALSTVGYIRRCNKYVFADTAARIEALTKAVAQGELQPPGIRRSVPDRPCVSCGRRERGKGLRCHTCVRAAA